MNIGRRFVLFFGLVSFLLVSCGGGGGGNDATVAAPGSFSLSGSWAGEYSLATGVVSFSGNMFQTNTALTGQLFTSTGFSLTLNGTVNGSTVDFTITGTAPGCSGNYTGTGQVLDNGTFNTLTFGFSGNDCTGPVSANGFMDSQVDIPSTIFDVSGSWSGSYTLPGPTGTVQVQGTLSQNGNQITGALIANNGSLLQVVGSVLSPTSINLSGQSGGNGCSGTFSGMGTLIADPLFGAQMTFTFSGVDTCAGVYNGATGSITRN